VILDFELLTYFHRLKFGFGALCCPTALQETCEIGLFRLRQAAGSN